MAFLHLTERIPKKVCLALSGGVDSMVGLDFCLKKGIEVIALHFNHGTANASKYEEFVALECKRLGVDLVIGRLDCPIPKGRSAEDFWREKRYDFFTKNCNDLNVVTCHHLDDAVETWIFSSLKGNSKVIPHKRGLFIRPFLLNPKKEIIEWATKNGVFFVQDDTNSDVSFDRNYIRNVIMPHAIRINPGIFKMVKKKIIASTKNSDQ